MKFPDKYSKTTEELKLLSKKKQIKYFDKKRFYLAKKLLFKPSNAIEAFDELSNQQLELGLITQEQKNEYDEALNKEVARYNNMQPHEIKKDLQDEFSKVKDTVKSKFSWSSKK